MNNVLTFEKESLLRVSASSPARTGALPGPTQGKGANASNDPFDPTITCTLTITYPR
jgi:hypothetical protein